MESDKSYFSMNAYGYYGDDLEHMVEMMERKEEPGQFWQYRSGDTQVLGLVVEKAFGQNISTLVSERFYKPMGAEYDAFWLLDGEEKREKAFCCFNASARDYARFGQLVLNKGNWNGSIILKDSNYFKEMTNSSQTINKSYGYLTWLNGKTSYMVPQTQFVFPGSISPDAPTDVIMALGKNGQLINVCPSKGLVWIRMGNAPSNNGLVPWIFNNEIWKYINQLPCAKTEDISLESEKLGLFPNVAKIGEMVLLQTKSKDVPQIFNSLWQSTKVEGEFNAEGYSINTQNMASGVYLVKLKSGQSVRMVLQ
jgi:CubicO group peptidase (beta-lactamase class C family)